MHDLYAKIDIFRKDVDEKGNLRRQRAELAEIGSGWSKIVAEQKPVALRSTSLRLSCAGRLARRIRVVLRVVGITASEALRVCLEGIELGTLGPESKGR